MLVFVLLVLFVRMTTRKVWLCGIRDMKVHKRELSFGYNVDDPRIDDLALDAKEFCKTYDGDGDSGASVYGFAKIHLVSKMGPLTERTSWDNEQQLFWNGVLDRPCADLYKFTVDSVCRLAEPISVQRLSDRKWRGMVVAMEELAAPRLHARLHEPPPWVPSSAAEMPNVAIRLPGVHAALVAVGAVGSFLLPHEKGSSSVSFRWSLLGYDSAQIPEPIPLASRLAYDLVDTKKRICCNLACIINAPYEVSMSHFQNKELV